MTDSKINIKSSDDFQYLKAIIPISFIISLLFTSCEKTIDFDLKKTEPQLVIEGLVKSSNNMATLNLSWSEDYYSTSGFVAVSNADAEISWGNGKYAVLDETTSGVYTADNIDIDEGQEYSLSVETDGKWHYASSVMPVATEIDSVFFMYSDKTLFAPEGFRVWAMFTDPGERGNYFRLQLFVNDEPVTNGIIYLWDDNETNGAVVQYIFYRNSLAVSDRFRVELWAIDKDTYNYYLALQALITDNQELQPAAPANPENNISDEVLGYFSAVAVYSSNTVQIPQP